MAKGAQTKQAIIDQALGLVSTVGLEKLSIGALAAATGMSKSGLFAHFKSKEQLQLQVLQEARERFVDLVVTPALKKPRGVPRIRAMFKAMLKQWGSAQPGGCIFYAVSAELDDQPGPARDYLVQIQNELHDTIKRAARIAVEEGEFREDLDVDQFAFEVSGITSACNHYGRLLSDPKAGRRAVKSFEALIERAR